MKTTERKQEIKDGGVDLNTYPMFKRRLIAFACVSFFPLLYLIGKLIKQWLS